jgi:hypothetical protein
MRRWRDKLADPTPPVVRPAPISIAGMKAGEIMLVPTVPMIDRFIRDLPRGCAVDIRTMRARLAAAAGAAVTCPIYTGYHLRAVAEAALEALGCGVPLAEITPFWRVIDCRTPTAKRLPCGLDFIAARRREEGLAP